jgi:hypothetical protein
MDDDKKYFVLALLLMVFGILSCILGIKFFDSTLFYYLGAIFMGVSYLIIFKRSNEIFLIPLILGILFLRIIPLLHSFSVAFNDPWHEIAVAKYFLENHFIQIIYDVEQYYMPLYSMNPALHILMGEISLLSGWALEKISLLFIILLNIIIILFLFFISKKLSKKYVFLPLILYGVLPDFIQWTMQSIRTFLGLFLLIFIIYLLTSNLKKKIMYPIITLFSILVLLTHHLSSIILVIILISYFISKKYIKLTIIIIFIIGIITGLLFLLLDNPLLSLISTLVVSIFSNINSFLLDWPSFMIYVNVSPFLLLANMIKLFLVLLTPLIIIIYSIIKYKKIPDLLSNLYFGIFCILLVGFFIPRIVGDFNRFFLFLSIPAIFLFTQNLELIEKTKYFIKNIKFKKILIILVIAIIIFLSFLFLWNKSFISDYLFDNNSDPDFNNGETFTYHFYDEFVVTKWIDDNTPKTANFFSDAYVQGIIVGETLRPTYHLTGEIFGLEFDRGINLIKNEVLSFDEESSSFNEFNYFVITKRMENITYLRTNGGYLFLINSEIDFESLNKVYSTQTSEIFYNPK